MWIFALNDEHYPSEGLLLNELVTIADSVARWVWAKSEFSAAGFSKLQAARSANRKVVQDSRPRWAKALLMSDAGLTAQEIAEQLGYASRGSVKDMLRAARKWREEQAEEFLALAG